MCCPGILAVRQRPDSPTFPLQAVQLWIVHPGMWSVPVLLHGAQSSCLRLADTSLPLATRNISASSVYYFVRNLFLAFELLHLSRNMSGPM